VYSVFHISLWVKLMVDEVGKVKNNIVVKDNNLVNASYELTLQEQRLMLGCISLIDSRHQIDTQRLYKIQVKDIGDLCGVVNTTHFYKDMVGAAKRLLKRTVKIGDKQSGVYGEAVWITRYVVDDRNRTIEVNFNEDVIPYLTSLQNKFTKYKLRDVAKFKSVYSIRIYEQLAQWKRVGYVELEIEKLRHILCVQDKYKTFSDLRKKVIEVAVSEITEYSNLDVSYGYRKEGRVIVAIQFRFETKKTPEKLPEKLTMDEYVLENPVSTKGKTEREVRKMMEKHKP
jgi:plasmid replication initiation protein